MKLVDLGEPTSFLDRKKVGCTQRECKPNEDIVNQHREMFESRISDGLTEKLPGSEKPHAETVAWSNGMEGHAKKCVERYCELANKKTERSTPCLGDHHFNMLTDPFFLSKKLYMARMGRPGIV